MKAQYKECNTTGKNDHTIELQNCPVQYNVICLFVFVWHPVVVNKSLAVVAVVVVVRKVWCGTNFLRVLFWAIFAFP